MRKKTFLILLFGILNSWSYILWVPPASAKRPADKARVQRCVHVGDKENQASATAVDNSGNLYVTGPSSEVLGEGEGYVTVKYDNGGTQLWVARYSDPANSEDFCSSVEVGSVGNVYVRLRNKEDEELVRICYGPHGYRLWTLRYEKGASQEVDDLSELFRLFTQPPYQEGWPLVEVMSPFTISQSLVADEFDVSDIEEELLLCMYQNVYAWNHNGTPMDGWPVDPDFNYRGASMIVSDSIGRIAFASHEDSGNVHVFVHTGSEANCWPKSTGSFIPRSPVWEDIDGDNIVEVIAAGVYGGHAWKPNGSYVPGWPVVVDKPLTGIAVGDVNDDGAKEVITTSMVLLDKRVYVISCSGEILYQWRPVDAATPGTENNPVLADLDGDGDLEILLGGYNDLFAWHFNGEEFWPRKILEGGADVSPIAVADVDSDSTLEVVACNSSRIYVWNNDGSIREGWPVSIPDIYWTWSSVEVSGPVIGDIDGDGEQEIVLNATGYDINYVWHIYAFNPNGTVVDGFPCVEPGGYVPSCTPVLADLDKDGDIEICSYAENHPNPGFGYLRVVVYDLLSSYNSSLVDWPMLQHDPRRTGCYKSGSIRGDANGNGVITISDAVYLINYLFTGGPAPNPLWTGDANCDGVVDIADVVYLINYLFMGGQPPEC